MLDIEKLKHIKENFDDIRKDKLSIDVNGNVYTNSSSIQPIISTKKIDTPDNSSNKKTNNILFWGMIGIGIFVILLVFIIFIRYLFSSSLPSQEIPQQSLQIPQQSNQEQQLIQPQLSQQQQQIIPQQSPTINVEKNELPQSFFSLKTNKSPTQQIIQSQQPMEEKYQSIKIPDDKQYESIKSKSLSKSIFDNFNNDKEQPNIIAQSDQVNSQLPSIPSLPSQKSKSMTEKASSSLASFFSFTPSRKEEDKNEEDKKEEEKEETKKIGGTKRKYIKKQTTKKCRNGVLKKNYRKK